MGVIKTHRADWASNLVLDGIAFGEGRPPRVHEAEGGWKA